MAEHAAQYMAYMNAINDRTLPQPVVSAYDAGMIATLRRELAERTHMADVWRGVAHAKQQTVDTQRGLIEELTAENDRLLPDAKQAHARNDEMCSEHMALRREIRELTAERDAWRETATAQRRWHEDDRKTLATPAEDRKTPRSEDAESPAAASGEKPDTGHPAGGRAPLPLRALRGGSGRPTW